MHPIQTWDALSGEEIKIKLCCNCAPGDNPAQSETCGHIGGKGNYLCRKCGVGGTQKSKESSEGFHKMFLVCFGHVRPTFIVLQLNKLHMQPGQARSSSETLRSVEEQVRAACLGVAQTVETLQTETGIKDAFTQSWIEHLIERARAMRKANPQRNAVEIQQELMEWVTTNREKIYNPFLSVKGEPIKSKFKSPTDHII